MTDSMKQFILRKLKENAPLNEIKRDLREKGHTSEEINKAVKGAISSEGGSPNTASIQILILVIGVLIAIGAGVYLTAGQSNEKKSSTASQLLEICRGYQADGTSCEDAVKFALSKYPGNASYVQKDYERTFSSPSGEPQKLEWKGWLIQIDLLNPIKAGNVTYYTIGMIVDGEGFAIHQFMGA